MPRGKTTRRTSRRADNDEPELGPDPRLARSAVERERARVEAAASPAALREAERIRGEQTGVRRSASSESGLYPQVARSKHTGRQFTVLHGVVGPFARGATAHESQFPEGTDFDRLLALEAIEELAESREQREARLIAEIPPAPPPTLTEAARSESSPTFPHAPDVAATRAEIAASLAEGVAASGPLPETREEALAQSEDAADVPAEDRAD